LGQLFFNISALASHLIEQSETQSPKKAGGNTDFDNFLKLSTVNEKIRQQRGRIPDFDLLYSILSNVPAVALDANQSEFLPYDNYTGHEDFGNSTAKLSENIFGMGSTAETYSPELMTASELKDILGSQTIPLTLDLKKSTVRDGLFAEKAQENKSSDQIQNNSLKTLQSLSSNKGAFQIETQGNLDNIEAFHEANQPGRVSDADNGTRIIVSAINPELNTMGSSSAKPVILPPDNGLSCSRITFTVDQLFKDNNRPVYVKVFDEADKVIDQKVSVARLRELVEKYPDKILIDVKSSSLNSTKVNSDNRFVSQQVLKAELPIIQQADTVKSVIFDLRALLSKNDSDNINVIQKTTNGDIQGIDTERVNISEKGSLNNNISEPKAGYKFNLKPITEKIGPISDQPEFSLRTISESDNKDALFRLSAQIKSARSNDENSSKKANEKSKELQLSNNKIVTDTKASIELGKGTKLSSINDDSVFKHQPGIKTQILSTDVKVENPIFNEPITSKTAENVEKIIDQLKSKLVINSKNTQIVIKLKPESLGRITINLKYEGEKINALFRVENPEVKFALDSEMPKLKANWKIDDFRVEINNFENNSGPFNNNRHHFNRTEHDHLNRSLLSNNELSGNEPNANNKISNSANLYGGAIDLIA